MRIKGIFCAALFCGLVMSSVSFAEEANDMQKMMMEKMKKQTSQSKDGEAVFNDTTLGTNGKSCGGCHAEAQKIVEKHPVDNHLAAYIQYCYEHALNGTKVIDKEKLDKMMAYFTVLQMRAAHTPSATAPGQPPMMQ